MNKTLLLAGAACLLAVNANAMELKPYVGLDYNYSDLKFAHAINNDIEDNYNSFSIDVGTKLHENFGVEAFYQKALNEKNSNQDEQYSSNFRAYGVDAIGYLPTCTNLEFLASAGVGKYTMKVRAPGEGSIKDSGTGYRLGLGAQYNINENVAIRGMVRHVYVQNSFLDDMNEVSLGARYTF